VYEYRRRSRVAAAVESYVDEGINVAVFVFHAPSPQHQRPRTAVADAHGFLREVSYANNFGDLD
jgi:hypothetical protein